MSQPNPYYPDFDFASKRDARGSAHGSNPPVNDANHTQEVRNIINDLQTAAREARARATAVEQERDDLAARLAEAMTQLGEIRQQFVEISSVLRERDEALHRADVAQRQMFELQRQVEPLSRERNEAIRLRDENARLARDAAQQLDEVQRQLVSIRAARDAAQAANLDLHQKLQEFRDEVNALRDDRDYIQDQLSNEATTLREKLEQASKSIADADRAELMRQIEELRSERDVLHEVERHHLVLTEEQTRQVAELARQVADAQRGREDLAAKCTNLEAELQRIQHQARASQTSQVPVASADGADVAALRQRLQEAEQQAAAAQAEADEARTQCETFAEKAEQAETQRLCAIDLAAQLENAKRDLIALAASLAEARLQNKATQSKLVRASMNAAGAAGGSGSTSTSAAPPLKLPTVPPQQSTRTPLITSDSPTQEILTEKEARNILTAIKECHLSYAKDANDLSLLNELHCHVHHLAERSRTSGFVALHRLSSALSLFAQELYRFPEQANSSSLRTLDQTIEFLSILLKQPDYKAIKDPSSAMVYAVDDDFENCDAIRMALETVMLRAQTAQQPAVALSEIAAGRYDLIFLDVNLPQMDGFELCKNIRQIPALARTPIVFLTGLTTIENRVQSSLSGGNDFIGKPFNLHELSVKALTLVLKASLNMD
jgi:CheY-like chemotaxis protein